MPTDSDGCRRGCSTLAAAGLGTHGSCPHPAQLSLTLPVHALPGKCSGPRGGPRALIWETTLQSQDPRSYRREGCSNAYGRCRRSYHTSTTPRRKEPFAAHQVTAVSARVSGHSPYRRHLCCMDNGYTLRIGWRNRESWHSTGTAPT